MDTTRPCSVADLKLEPSQLPNESPELFIFQWLSQAEQSLTSLTPEDLKPSQAPLEQILLAISSATTPYPSPGRPIRQLVARCFLVLFGKGESRTLFDVLQALFKVVNDVKGAGVGARICCLFAAGEIMQEFGSQVMSVMAEATSTTLKLSKQSSAPVQLRYHALLTLSKSLSSASRAINDSTAKDIFKQARSCLSDKAQPLQRASAMVLRTLYQQGRAALSVTEIETLTSTCVRSLELADRATRQAFADLLAHVLILAQRQALSAPEPSRKPAKKGANEAEEADEMDIRTAPEAPAATLMTLEQTLGVLSGWMVRPGTTRRMAVGIAEIYSTLFLAMGPSSIEASYPTIIHHLLTDLISHPRALSSRQDVLLFRRIVGILLRDVIGVRMLSEQGQISAIRELASGYLGKWPALMPGTSAPNSKALVVALTEVAGLIHQLGNAPPPVQDALSSPLVDLLSHPSRSVRIASAWALKVFCFSAPLRLAKSVITIMDLFQKDISSILVPSSSSSETAHKLLGHAYGLAALVSSIPQRPLYISYDLSAKVLDSAIQLLKRAGEHDVGVSVVEIEAAWTTISALMALGPNFVRAHLSQLLVLWRNALPKPTSKDSSAGRSKAEWNYLLRVRESALSAVLNFLTHNSPALVTLDVSRRLSSLLSNALNFVNAFAVQYRAEVREAVPSSSTSTSDDVYGFGTQEATLRRRIFQCFSALSVSSLQESTQVALLDACINLFAGADGALGSSAQASIASSSGAFVSIWSSTDGYAYGLTSLDPMGVGSGTGLGDAGFSERPGLLVRDSTAVALENLTRVPILTASEHDVLNIWRDSAADFDSVSSPSAPTAVVDASISLFASLLPVQDLASIERFINQLIEFARSPKLERNAGRKAAVVFNATTALLMALSKASEQGRHARDTFGSAQVSQRLSVFLKDSVLSGDAFLRSIGSEALGKLASFADTTFLATQITMLVDFVVQNRDFNGRAGCSAAFGSIFRHVGGLVTGPLLKTTVNVLMSLSNDPHPTVHFHALTALADVISAASLSYSPFISPTLALLVKLYLLDSHEPEGGALHVVNTRGDLPAYQIMCQMIDAVIGVLGPELMEPGRTRALTLDLVNQFFNETDEGTRIQSVRCVQHLLIFGSNYMPLPGLVARFRANLSSKQRPLKLVSIHVLYALVQKDALILSKVGGDRLVEDLFGMLDDDASVEGVRGVILSWLRQTVMHGPSAWIDLCQRIMSKSTAFQPASSSKQTGGAFGQDDEAEALSIGLSNDAGDGGSGGQGSTTSRWRTQLFALQCLHLICTTVAESGAREHLDLQYARAIGANERGLLVSRVPDLVRMAFTASAAYVTDIRLEGLVVLRDIIEIFSHSPDPDYSEVLLLEQYQAPITSALTPAFSSDSTPEILASAIETCGTFVGCGVIKESNRMGRILKLLTTTLQQCKASSTLSIGDAQELSPNASVMLRVATLAAWAGLEVSSVEKSYLQAVIKDHRPTLAVLWTGSLRDFANIRADSELVQEGSSAALDVAYTGLGREVLLPYYHGSWIKILHAVATSMQKQDPFMLAAMDGLEVDSADPAPAKSGPRREATLMYPILLGLVFELLSQSSDAASAQTGSGSTLIALRTLASLVRPEYSGDSLFDAAPFAELVAVLYRMTLTEPPEVQIAVVQVVLALVTSRDAASLQQSGGGKQSIVDSSPLSHCLRICAYAARSALTAVGGGSDPAIAASRVALIREALVVFMTIAKSLSSSALEDARGTAIALYMSLLQSENSDIDLVGPTLPALRSILLESSNASERYSQTLHAALSACLQNVDEMSGRESPRIDLKVKNNLLAAVLVLTIAPAHVRLSLAAVEHCCFLISERLGSGNDETTLAAAQCARTIIMAASGGLPIVQPCVKLLMPGVIRYLARTSARLQTKEPLNSTQAQTVAEILQALNVLVNQAPDAQKHQALAVILPVFILLLDPTQTPVDPIHASVMASVLSFATSASGAFKEVTAKLDAKQREILEASVRLAVGGLSDQNAAPTVAKRTISLRTF